MDELFDMANKANNYKIMYEKEAQKYNLLNQELLSIKSTNKQLLSQLYASKVINFICCAL